MSWQRCKSRLPSDTALGRELRVQLKSEIDLPEMIVTRENVRDTELPHDDHAGEIDEGDVRFVVKFLAHVPGKPKLRRRDVREQIVAGVYFGQQCPAPVLQVCPSEI